MCQGSPYVPHGIDRVHRSPVFTYTAFYSWREKEKSPIPFCYICKVKSITWELLLRGRGGNSKLRVCYSCRRLEFSSQHSHWAAYSPCNSDSGGSYFSSSLWGTVLRCMHPHRDTYIQWKDKKERKELLKYWKGVLSQFLRRTWKMEVSWLRGSEIQ